MLWILSHLNLLVHKRPQLNPYYSLKINSSRAIGIHTSSLARIQTFRRCMSTSHSFWRSQTDHVATTLKLSSSMVADVPVTVSAPGGAFSSHLWTISKQLLLNSHLGVGARWKKYPQIPFNDDYQWWSPVYDAEFSPLIHAPDQWSTTSGIPWDSRRRRSSIAGTILSVVLHTPWLHTSGLFGNSPPTCEELLYTGPLTVDILRRTLRVLGLIEKNWCSGGVYSRRTCCTWLKCVCASIIICSMV